MAAPLPMGCHHALGNQGAGLVRAAQSRTLCRAPAVADLGGTGVYTDNHPGYLITTPPLQL